MFLCLLVSIFINILWSTCSFKRVVCSLSVLTACVCIFVTALFWQKVIGKKANDKLLVKLTLGMSQILLTRGSCHKLWQIENWRKLSGYWTANPIRERRQKIDVSICYLINVQSECKLEYQERKGELDTFPFVCKYKIIFTNKIRQQSFFLDMNSFVYLLVRNNFF